MHMEGNCLRGQKGTRTGQNWGDVDDTRTFSCILISTTCLRFGLHCEAQWYLDEERFSLAQVGPKGVVKLINDKWTPRGLSVESLDGSVGAFCDQDDEVRTLGRL